MPLYDFRCERCGQVEEFLLAIGAPGPVTHERCGGALERVYAPTSVHFKGSGWAKLERRGQPEGTGGTASSGSATSPSAAPSPSPAPSKPNAPKGGVD
jgi:putative FmdB family regulatory protein